MLRRVLLWLGALLAAAGLAAAWASWSPAGLLPAAAGVVLLLAVGFERQGYQPTAEHLPGPDWVPTGEQFLDPASNVPVQVYFHPATGKRIYVRSQ